MIVFPRHLPKPLESAGEGTEGLERLWLAVEGGRVEVWYLPAYRSESRHGAGPLVVFAHGNAELIDYWPEVLEPYRRMGVGVLLPEYRGYGRSGGLPSEDAIVGDFLRAIEMISKKKEVDPSRIVYHGRSIGGGVACSLARRRKPASLILQSTFTSLSDMAARFLVPGFLLLDSFDNIGALQKLDVPVFIFHGRQDGLVPFEHARRLAGAAANSRLLALDGDHNSCPRDWNEVFREIEEWLGEQGILPP